MSFTVRKAKIGDAPLLSDLGRRLFFETFGPHNSVDDMSSYLAETYNVGKQIEELADEKRVTYLAFAVSRSSGSERSVGDESKPAGYITLHESRPKEGVKAKRSLQLQRLYVDKPFHGKGLAQQLMQLALTTAHERQYSSLWLTVWVSNLRARKFYEKYGFKRVGDARFAIGKKVDTDDVLEKELD